MADVNEVLRVSAAYKRFGKVDALRGADLSLARGEWLALLGPNGAGKTTLVRSIAGRVHLDRGDINLLGQELGSPDEAANARAKLGTVPQDIALYPRLTAEENLSGFGRMRGLTGGELRSRVDWALDWTGLADRASEPSERFSGGMKRRLNIACSVLHHPEVILLDEPTVGVDPQSRQRIWEMLEQLRKDGASLLLTTHQLDEAQNVCDRIVIIDNGAVAASGTFTELLQQTIGSQRLVTLSLAGDPPESLRACGFEFGDNGTVHRSVNDIATALPKLLAEVEEAGSTITDLHIESPSLQTVFIHLTGRELRE